MVTHPPSMEKILVRAFVLFVSVLMSLQLDMTLVVAAFTAPKKLDKLSPKRHPLPPCPPPPPPLPHRPPPGGQN